jgi:hypothetical protein
MTIRSAVLVSALGILTTLVPSVSQAQVTSTTLMSAPISRLPPSGAATGTTDRQGQTKRPSHLAPTSAPREVPKGWHIPLPWIHHRG